MDQYLPDYWDNLDHHQVLKAHNFVGLARVALRVLKRMPTNEAIVQVCGPITSGGLGSEALNMARFATAIEILRLDGYNVFNQLPFESHMKRLLQTCPPNDLLEHFYGRIFASGLVKLTFFLPHWWTSIGSRWERARLRCLGVPIAEFPKRLLERVEAGKALFS